MIEKDYMHAEKHCVIYPGSPREQHGIIEYCYWGIGNNAGQLMCRVHAGRMIKRVPFAQVQIVG